MRVVLLLAAGAAWEPRALAALSGRRDLVVLKRCVDVDDLLATATSGQADTAVVALEAPGLDVAAVDHLRGHGVRTVAVAAPPVEQAAARATRIGVRSLLPDAEVERLPAAVTDEEPEPPAAPSRGGAGRVVTVWGAAGAPGRTTVATGLAAALARTTRTTLVDADPYAGSVAQVLGVLDEVSGLLAAARLVSSGLLEERFTSVQRALSAELTVVTGLPRPDRWSEVRPGTVEAVARTAAQLGHVVLDTGFGLEDDDAGGRPGRHRITAEALDVADEVVVVGTADPVGLSRLARALVELRERRPAARTRVVVNRMRPSIGWSEREVTQMLSDLARPVGLHFLPEDRATVDRALVTGRSLLETDPASPLAQALAAVAAAQTGQRPAPRRRVPVRGVRLRPRTAGTTRPR